MGGRGGREGGYGQERFAILYVASKLHKSVNTRNKKDRSGVGWGG